MVWPNPSYFIKDMERPSDQLKDKDVTNRNISYFHIWRINVDSERVMEFNNYVYRARSMVKGIGAAHQ